MSLKRLYTLQWYLYQIYAFASVLHVPHILLSYAPVWGSSQDHHFCKQTEIYQQTDKIANQNPLST